MDPARASDERPSTVRIEPVCPLCGGRELDGIPPPERWIGADVFGTFRERFGLAACRGCGFVFTNPRPGRALLEQFYSGVVYPRRNAASDPWLAPVSEAQRARAEYLLGVIERYAPPGALLDYGCTAGAFLRCAAARGWRPEGYDVGDALARCRARGLRVTDRLEDFAPGAFDVVLLNQVFEHVEDRAGLLARLRPLLAPRGLLFVQVPNAGSLRARVAHPLLARHLRLEERYRSFPAHLAYFTPRTLAGLLARAGYRVEHTETFGLGLAELRAEAAGYDPPSAAHAVAPLGVAAATDEDLAPRAAPRTPAGWLRGVLKRAFGATGLGENVLVVARP
jgi:2-polyprenyl-3-methyl-5-hydroxy-6-metoxy-1,4-benzoquinol methylase